MDAAAPARSDPPSSSRGSCSHSVDGCSGGRRPRWPSAWIAALLALACGSGPSEPGTDDDPYASCVAGPYGFAISESPLRVFHWPTGSGVRVRVHGEGEAEDEALSEAVDSALAAWSRAAGPEVDLIRRDFTFGEVLVAWGDAMLPLDTRMCEPVDSIATTTFCLDESGTRIRRFPAAGSASPTPTAMLITLDRELAQNPPLLRRWTAHELGHVLGVLQHSSEPLDLLAVGLLQTAVPTCRDRATLKALYRTPATVSTL